MEIRVPGDRIPDIPSYDHRFPVNGGANWEGFAAGCPPADSAVTVSHYYSTRSCASASSRSSRCMYLCVVEMFACPRSRRAYLIPFSRQIFVPHSCRAELRWKVESGE